MQFPFNLNLGYILLFKLGLHQSLPVGKNRRKALYFECRINKKALL